MADPGNPADFVDGHNGPLSPDRPPLPETWEELLDGAIAYLRANWKGSCRCGGTTWLIQEIVALQSAPEKYPIAGDSARGFYAALPVECGGCGEVVLINASRIFRQRR